ncbi:sterol desaturase family protein [Rhodocaloribacter sp.]
MQAILSTLQTWQMGAYAAVLTAMLVWESLHPFFDLFRGSPKARGVHFFRNMLLGAVNSLLIAAVFVGLWLATAEWAEAHHFGLMNWAGAAFGLPSWAHALGVILLFDAWTCTWHRINHRIPFLWRFHRVHHADTQMDVTTAGRFHVGEILLSSALRIPLIALFGAYVWELVLYETMMFAVVQFHHANVALPERLDRALRTVIVTPAMHKVHHSRLQPETDSNYSTFLSVWDRLGRSFRLRKNPAEIRFGLDAFDDPRHETVKGLMKMPLLDVEREAEKREA